MRRESEFEQAVLPHTRALLRFAVRLTRNVAAAEDLVQDTLVLAWRAFDRLESQSRSRAWLFTILMNAFRGQCRKARSSPPMVELVNAAGAAAPGFDALEVGQALDRLAADHRTALLLAVVEGFTCKEIAQILDVPIGTVMSRLSRAREALRAALLTGEGVAR